MLYKIIINIMGRMVELEYNENKRTNSEMNEQTTPEDHTNSMEWTTIMAECRHVTKIISRIELRKQK